MTRNKDILSEKEMFEKTSHMIEHAVDARIKLQYKKGSNCCAFDGYEGRDDVKIFRINIANPPDKYNLDIMSGDTPKLRITINWPL